MVITQEEALLIVIMVGAYFSHQGFIVSDNPTAEGLGEVKLLRRIAKEFPSLQSHVDLVLSGG